MKFDEVLGHDCDHSSSPSEQGAEAQVTLRLLATLNLFFVLTLYMLVELPYAGMNGLSRRWCALGGPQELQHLTNKNKMKFCSFILSILLPCGTS